MQEKTVIRLGSKDCGRFEFEALTKVMEDESIRVWVDYKTARLIEMYFHFDMQADLSEGKGIKKKYKIEYFLMGDSKIPFESEKSRWENRDSELESALVIIRIF